MIRVLIVDDEPYARRELRRLLEGQDDFEVVGELGSGQEALASLDEMAPDVVFLDIQMPGMTGIEVIERVPAETRPIFVFVTAYDRYAVEAFELAAVDYLLKPLREDRFASCLERVSSLVQGSPLETAQGDIVDLLEGYRRALAGSRRYEKHLVVRTRKGDQVIATRSIYWIGAEDDYVRLHLGATNHLAKSSMIRLAALLDPERFVRVHRSTIVNLDAVVRIESKGAGPAWVHLRDGSRRRVSRSGRRRLEEVTEFLG